MKPHRKPNDKRRRYWLVKWDEFHRVPASERRTLTPVATYDTAHGGRMETSDALFLWDKKRNLGWNRRAGAWDNGCGDLF